MSFLVQLLVGIAASIPSFLSADGIISTNLQKLLDASLTAISGIVAAIKGGGTVTNELQPVLTALQAEYTAIRQDTSADPKVIGAIAEVSNLLDDAISGFDAAQTTDPSTLSVPPAVA